MDTGAMLGRRDRNKAAKRAAILGAARALFTEHGYSSTTTHQVARAADVAEGTLFRYSATKPELLIMVINERLRPLVVDAGPRGLGTPEDEVLGLLGPLIELAEAQPENAAVYLREVLFGEDGPQRREALALVDAIVGRVATVLAPFAPGFPGMRLDEAARWVFSALVGELLRGVVSHQPTAGLATLRVRVRVLLRGLGVSA